MVGCRVRAAPGRFALIDLLRWYSRTASEAGGTAFIRKGMPDTRTTHDIRHLVAALRTGRQRDQVAARFAPLAPASDEQVARAQLELGLAFPEDFAYLQTTLGGGVVGLTWTYSINPEGENPIREINGGELQPRSDFLAFSDNGAGDYYGFKIAHGTAVPGVWVLDHETGELSKTADTFT